MIRYASRLRSWTMILSVILVACPDASTDDDSSHSVVPSPEGETPTEVPVTPVVELTPVTTPGTTAMPTPTSTPAPTPPVTPTPPLDSDHDGYSVQDGDCDDNNPAAYPGAEEIPYDGIDQDCDGLEITDADHDGFDVDVDCDDTAPDVHPNANETCDGRDEDCDGTADDNAVDAPTWYGDRDGDGHGNPVEATTSCTQPEGFVADNADCNDADDRYHPGATEDDCTDPNDYNCDGSVSYEDADGDGYPACNDCDDNNGAVHAGQNEVCNGLDDDCDGQVDGSDAFGAQPVYADVDGDGYGNLEDLQMACSPPEGYVADGTDCDDTNAGVHPGAAETCNGVDDDCNGKLDDDPVDAPTWYVDGDADGFGNDTFSSTACDAPPGYVAEATDCNDLDPGSYPGATERCDGLDNDCNGVADDSAADWPTWYIDADGDGHGGDTGTVEACEQPPGYAVTPDDCDDTNPSVAPGAPEVCNDVDDDCDGEADEDPTDAPTWYADDDQDQYGDPDTTKIACDMPAGYQANGDDCDDTRASVFPGALEACNGLDDNCDGTIDEDAADAPTWYADNDNDGFGLTGDTLDACLLPDGYAQADGDCDDDDPAIYPGAEELCDGADNDCDGEVDAGLLGDDPLCAGSSCASILAARPDATDGLYWLDPETDGAPVAYLCDMVTDGGGWTRVARWDRENDGDTLADFETLMTLQYNNMSEWIEGTSYIQWSDMNSNADVMAYARPIEVPNGGETRLILHYYGYSMEESATFFYIQSGDQPTNIVCNNYINSAGYSSLELSYLPGYTCPNQSAGNLNWNATWTTPAATQIDTFHIRSFHWDGSHGDYSQLYRFELWVR